MVLGFMSDMPCFLIILQTYMLRSWLECNCIFDCAELKLSSDVYSEHVVEQWKSCVSMSGNIIHTSS